LFDDAGQFGVVKRRGETGATIQSMWALNLLRFTPAEDGVWAIGNDSFRGFLYVYTGRMTMVRGTNIEPISTIDPGNVRFVNSYNSFRTKVSESGWLFDEHTASFWLPEGNNSVERLEEILADAEAGKKPPFFTWEQFIKVESGLVGKTVAVIKFSGINDRVVVDLETRKLVGRDVQKLLSRERWEPQAVNATYKPTR